MTDEYGVAIGERTWRLPLSQRLFAGASFSGIPVLVALFIATPSGSSPGPVSWEVLAATILVWLVLAWGVWRTSVMLTIDALVIRNMYTTRRIPLAAVTGVTIRRNFLYVTEGGGINAPTGRYYAGTPRAVHAVPTTAAYWTGLRSEADMIAATIAAAAGLEPGGPPRKQWLNQRTARLVLAAGIACVGFGAFFGPMHGAGTGIPFDIEFAGALLWPIGFAILEVGIPATISHARHR